MIKLNKVKIHKFKSFEKEQVFEVDDKVTIIVGMNESGKTAALESVAKTNYFQNDEKFKFNTTHDFPRRLKKQSDKSGVEELATTCYYAISDGLLKQIEADIGKDVFKVKSFHRSMSYDNNAKLYEFTSSVDLFVDRLLKKHQTSAEQDFKTNIKNSKKILELLNSNEENAELAKEISKYLVNELKWDDWLAEYIYRAYVKPNLPKFLYYDEYYALPSRISIEEIKKGKNDSDELKTAKALFELADINIDELLHAENFEDYKAELEATEAIISDELFKYWETNQNLSIEFDIDKKEKTDAYGHNRIVEHILDIRVKNSRSRVSLPLQNRSKGFNWFFSFLVWFKKIQEDSKSNYILLLDEPGLNLHAKAQDNLLRFIEDLSQNYQIIYTTHSPFMIDSSHLERVRTVVETTDGSNISDSIQEKDPNTLFPLQAALGYDIAQNLFVSKCNLLVEGVSDLIYLQVISGLLESEKREFLDSKITIVPVGGLDKVGTFISLLRGSKLDIACLLDSFLDQKNKDRLDTLIQGKIIHSKKVRFYNEFIPNYDHADIEDLFDPRDYLQLFNGAYSGEHIINESDVVKDGQRIISKINKIIQRERFNHYRPANYLATNPLSVDKFNQETLLNFENMFKEINRIFS